MADLAPNGWDKTPFPALFHEAATIRTGLPHIHAGSNGAISEQASLAQIEARLLVGSALWTICSDNNDVLASTGKVVILGTSRGSAQLISDWLNTSVGVPIFEYMDLYGGFDPDVLPHVAVVLELVFRRLATCGFQWRPDARAAPTIVQAYCKVFAPTS